MKATVNHPHAKPLEHYQAVEDQARAIAQIESQARTNVKEALDGRHRAEAQRDALAAALMEVSAMLLSEDRQEDVVSPFAIRIAREIARDALAKVGQ